MVKSLLDIITSAKGTERKLPFTGELHGKNEGELKIISSELDGIVDLYEQVFEILLTDNSARKKFYDGLEELSEEQKEEIMSYLKTDRLSGETQFLERDYQETRRALKGLIEYLIS